MEQKGRNLLLVLTYLEIKIRIVLLYSLLFSIKVSVENIWLQDIFFWQKSLHLFRMLKWNSSYAKSDKNASSVDLFWQSYSIFSKIIFLNFSISVSINGVMLSDDS